MIHDTVQDITHLEVYKGCWKVEQLFCREKSVSSLLSLTMSKGQTCQRNLTHSESSG